MDKKTLGPGQDLGFPFPRGFWWGTSLAAHQAEGGNHNSWTEWEEHPSHIKNNDKSGLACDHWNRYHEDFERLSWLNANTHRFSIEWSRLEPKQGEWNKSAENHYRKMIHDLKARDIRPVLCLFHFTLPIWVSDQGGFENAKTIEAFVHFAKRAQTAFGDLVKDWLTLNEPVAYAVIGYAAGLTPPGVEDYSRAMRVSVNLLRAHGQAYHAIKNQDPQSHISWAQHLRVFTPKNRFSPLDHWGAWVADEVMNWSWYKTIQTGKININIPGLFRANEESPECLGAMDFIGFNYYSRDIISVNPFLKQKFILTVPKKSERTDMNWEIFPEGLEILLKEIKSHKLGHYPLLLTENGIADHNDKKRSNFIYQHLKVFLKTCDKLGLKPMGYLYWSLIDNFEWIDGFGPRFGLFEVNYNTLERKPRLSAYYFREMGRLRALVPPTDFSP